MHIFKQILLQQIGEDNHAFILLYWDSNSQPLSQESPAIAIEPVPDPIMKIDSNNLRYVGFECSDWLKKLEQPFRVLKNTCSINQC